MFLGSALLPLVLAASFQPQVSVQQASGTGHVQLQAGVLSAPLQGALPSAVQLHALRQRASLGLPDDATLSVPRAFGTRFGASFHMDQLVDGIEVHNAKVIVTVDANRQVVQLTSSVAPYTHVERDWRLSADEALVLGAQAVNLSLWTNDGRPYGGVKRRMFPYGDALRAGYLLWVPTADLRENWFLAIDAATGEVLWRRNRVFHAANDADVYAISPGGLDAGVGVAPVQRVSLSHLSSNRPGGYLVGTQIDALNCCPNENCSTASGAAPKQAVGQMATPQGMMNYDIAVCDRRPLASNDPLVNPNATFVYTPVDPSKAPYTGGYANQLEPSDSDPFVEVNAFHHVNGVYQFMRELSMSSGAMFPGETIPAFQMRDERNGNKPVVWTNVTLPDFNDAYLNLFTQGVFKTTKLTRMDNAAFMARENFAQLMIPEIALPVDTLMIFQGSVADFGYDAPVLWHEFGHGVIYSTAAFESFTLDARSGNNEGGALHEGIADFIAGIYGGRSRIGEYIGPRAATLGGAGEGALRDMENAFSCPGVLWGEVHQDSQHFSAALWEARKLLSAGIDDGETFDAAFYAALVSMTPATDFLEAAAIITNHVKLAFHTVPDAEQKMVDVFRSRGVVECSKVLEITAESDLRTYFGIGGSSVAGLAAGQIVPGPYQFKISLPNGAKAVSMSGATQGGGFGGPQPKIRLMAKVGAPVTFTRQSTQLTHDADVVVNASGGQATAQVAVPCGGDLYLAVGSANENGDVIQNLGFKIVAADGCAMDPDGGTNTGTDGGTGANGDGGVVTVPAIEDGAVDDEVASGCGCTSVDPLAAAFGLLALVGAARRRRHLRR